MLCIHSLSRPMTSPTCQSISSAGPHHVPPSAELPSKYAEMILSANKAQGKLALKLSHVTCIMYGDVHTVTDCHRPTNARRQPSLFSFHQEPQARSLPLRRAPRGGQARHHHVPTRRVRRRERHHEAPRGGVGAGPRGHDGGLLQPLPEAGLKGAVDLHARDDACKRKKRLCM